MVLRTSALRLGAGTAAAGRTVRACAAAAAVPHTPPHTALQGTARSQQLLPCAGSVGAAGALMGPPARAALVGAGHGHRPAAFSGSGGAPPALPVITHAIVRGLPRSMAAGALRKEEPQQAFDYARAVAQHAAYTEALRDLVPHVVRVEPDEATPDCVFVEDSAVTRGDTVLMCRIGHPSRVPETPAIRAAVSAIGGLRVVDIVDEGATIDGGDVLFTGREFLVGLSGRTNAAGVEALRAAFPAYPVAGVPVSGALHLKSLMTWCGPDMLVVSACADGAAARAAVSASAAYADRYSWLEVPDVPASNCVLVNGAALVRAEFPRSVEVFEGAGIRTVPLAAGECQKMDGALTCMSLLLEAPRHVD